MVVALEEVRWSALRTPVGNIKKEVIIVFAAFFVSAVVVAPLPPLLKPERCLGELCPKPGKPTTLIVFARVEFKHMVKGEQIQLRRIPKAPPKVLLLEAYVFKPPPGSRWDFHNPRSYRVDPYRPDLHGELTEVWVRDEFGRVLTKFPIKAPKPKEK